MIFFSLNGCTANWDRNVPEVELLGEETVNLTLGINYVEKGIKTRDRIDMVSWSMNPREMYIFYYNYILLTERQRIHC